MKSLSQKSKYALRALQRLARSPSGEPVLIAQMAKEGDIPKKFLELILLTLKNHGLLESKRGKGGGYCLRLPAAEISLGQVIRIFDGPLAPLPCVSETAFKQCDDCEDFATCGTRLVMQEVRDSMAKILDNTNLADLTRRVDQLISEKQRDPMYHI